MVRTNLHSASLLDFARPQPYFSRRDPLHGGNFQDTAERWRNSAATLAPDVQVLRGVVDRAGRRYFGGQALLFGEEQRTLDAFQGYWEVLFNEGVVAEGSGLPVPPVVALDSAAVQRIAGALTDERIGMLLDAAKVDTLHDLGDVEGAASMLGKHP